MTSFRTLLIAGVACTGVSAPLSAQIAVDASTGVTAEISADAQTTDMPANGDIAGGARNPNAIPVDDRATVGELIGQNVQNAIGESIGEIDDVVTIRGEAMAVVGVGGVFGFGEKDVALPMTELTLTEDAVTAMGYTREQLKSMREYRADIATPMKTDTMVVVGSS